MRGGTPMGPVNDIASSRHIHFNSHRLGGSNGYLGGAVARWGPDGSGYRETSL